MQLRTIAVILVFSSVVAYGSPAFANNLPDDTSVDFSQASPGIANLSAHGGQTSLTPMNAGPISSPRLFEGVDASYTDPCQDANSIIVTVDYSQCWVATPGFGVGGEPTPADARRVVLSYVRSMKLPSPRPESSAPDGGICGVIHTLDLHIDDINPAFYDPTTEFGPMIVRFHGKFTVDWGDGSKNVYRTAGGPYPNDSISHYWTDRGFYDIQVTADWTAEWSLGGFSGVVGGFRTTGSIDQWRVWEAQAMLIK